MSTLKVNKLRDTAGSADAIVLDPNGGAVLAGVTTMTTARVTSGIVTNTFIVGAGVTISESGIEASGIGITAANINGTQIGGRRNLMINGAFTIAQRGTSSTSDGYKTVDRFQMQTTGVDEAPTQSQGTVASGTTPYTEGFRTTYKITNGNQTSGAGAGDYIYFRTALEAQDIVNSGWNYLSSSSFITLSFWVKSSVAQNFYGYVRANDGTVRHYPFETGSLSADTWTKVIETIPGNSGLTFDNNTGAGFQFTFLGLMGTNFTSSGVNLRTWIASGSGNVYTPDNTTTWYTTNDATLEITGVQLEVGSQATPFEHRSYQDELYNCKRYFQGWGSSVRFPSTSSNNHATHQYVVMRATPTLVRTGDLYGSYESGSTTAAATYNINVGQLTLLSYGNSSDKAVGGYGTLEAEI